MKSNPNLGVPSFDSHSASSSFFLAARARISSRLTGTRASPPSRIANVWESSLTMCMCYTYVQDARVKRDKKAKTRDVDKESRRLLSPVKP